MDNHEIIITRASSFLGCALSYEVELDGASTGTLKNGETISISSQDGNHFLSFISKGKIVKRISVVINQDQHVVRLFVKINGQMKLDVLNGDTGKPFSSIPPVGKPSSHHQKKKHPVLIAIAIAFIAMIAIPTMVNNFSGNGSSSTQNSQSSGMTDEEKAASQVEKATSSFQNNDYASAIKICQQVVSDYPETSSSENMSSYLADQYSAFNHFSAKDLMSEYDSNIVNADKEYTNTVMVVSGIVSSIGKTNNDTNLSVMLDSDTYFYGVQLNFKTNQTDSVAALKEGDSVTAIGKCTGKSGVHFIVLDSNNVMVENCYLIE